MWCPAEQMQCLYTGSELGTHIIQAFPTLLTSKTLVIAKSEGSFRTDFLPQAGAIEHITSTFILMNTKGDLAKSVTYFTNEGCEGGFVKTNGEAVFQKDVNDSWKQPVHSKETIRVKKVNAVKLQ